MLKRVGSGIAVKLGLSEPNQKFRRFFVAGIMCLGSLGIVGTAVTANDLPAGAATRISGTVWCNADQVVGVWIQASSGGSGWASWASLGTDTNQASYSYSLPNGGAWTVHVGCSGSPSHWQYSPDGDVTTTHSVVNWFCFTPDGGTSRYYCYILSY